MLKNRLLEQILCERYQNKSNKDCNCKSINEQQLPPVSDTSPTIDTIFNLLISGGATVMTANKLLSDLSKFVGPYNSPESRDRYSPNEDPYVQLIQPEPNLKTPRKARIKEFGQATGQVISPS